MFSRGRTTYLAQLTKKSDNNQYLYSLEASTKMAFMLIMLSSKEIIYQNAAAADDDDNDDDDDDYYYYQLSRKFICSTEDITFHKRIT